MRPEDYQVGMEPYAGVGEFTDWYAQNDHGRNAALGQMALECQRGAGGWRGRDEDTNSTYQFYKESNESSWPQDIGERYPTYDQSESMCKYDDSSILGQNGPQEEPGYLVNRRPDQYAKVEYDSHHVEDLALSNQAEQVDYLSYLDSQVDTYNQMVEYLKSKRRQVNKKVPQQQDARSTTLVHDNSNNHPKEISLTNEYILDLQSEKQLKNKSCEPHTSIASPVRHTQSVEEKLMVSFPLVPLSGRYV